jgi:hypothetical protein
MGRGMASSLTLQGLPWANRTMVGQDPAQQTSMREDTVKSRFLIHIVGSE